MGRRLEFGMWNVKRIGARSIRNGDELLLQVRETTESKRGSEMSEIDSGGPAFPMPHEQMQTGVWGLTKREWFAGMALMGVISRGMDYSTDGLVESERAYIYADAMIRAGKGENR